MYYNVLYDTNIGTPCMGELYTVYCRPTEARWPKTVREMYVSKFDHCYNYCKSGNIRGTLIFRVFRANSASANSKTRENICNILYAHFGHVQELCIDHMC